MVLFSHFSSIFLLTTLLLQSQIRAQLILTVFNNCPFTIWPAIQPNSGHPVLEQGGFSLEKLTYRSFLAPTTFWSGRVWARTGCSHNRRTGRFTCATGDCGGHLECNGLGGSPPFTIAQLTLHQGPTDKSSYDVTLVDGFNLPMTVTPHEGHGQCPVVGCMVNLLGTCPHELQVQSPSNYGPIVACKSACNAFNTDQYCCRGYFNSPNTCKSSSYSNLFKRYCPTTYTYPYDTPSLPQDCDSPRELKVIFCQ